MQLGRCDVGDGGLIPRKSELERPRRRAKVIEFLGIHWL